MLWNVLELLYWPKNPVSQILSTSQYSDCVLMQNPPDVKMYFTKTVYTPRDATQQKTI